MFGLILIGAFLTVVLFIVGIEGIYFSEKRNTLSRLMKYTSEKYEYMEASKPENDLEFKHILEFFGNFEKYLPRNRYLEKKKIKLMQASVLMKPEEFLGLSMISAIIIAILIFIITKSILVGLIFIVIGFKVPDLFIGFRKANRMVKINSKLSEALDIISNGLRAGFSFTQAMAIVTSEIQGPISEEFGKVLRDNSLGKSLEQALKEMSDRTDDEDLDMVITALLIQRQVGGNLAEVLDTISNTIRERVKIKGDVRTLTAQGRMSAFVVSLLPFALGIALNLINPGYLDILFSTFIGKAMIVVGVVMQLIGIFVLLKLVNIKV